MRMMKARFLKVGDCFLLSGNVCAVVRVDERVRVCREFLDHRGTWNRYTFRIPASMRIARIPRLSV